jgi:hypothetical protein
MAVYQVLAVGFQLIQPAGPSDVGSSASAPGTLSTVHEFSDNIGTTDPSPNIGRADIQNLTGVMIQILSRLDAQDNKIVNIASLVENKVSPSNIPSNMPAISQQHTDMHSAPILTAHEACSLHPTLHQFRNDSALVAQAHQHINQMEEDNLGKNNTVSATGRSQKRGLVRLGGENAPIVQIQWPHDFVLGVGEKRHLYYSDLNWPQFLQGYTTIIERETDDSVVRAMVSHLKQWAIEANCHGFEKAKHLHASILTDMEDGLYGWLNKEAMAEARKDHKMPSNNDSVKTGFDNQKNNSSKSNNSSGNFKKFDFKRAPQGEVTALSCYNFNQGKCKFSADHELANILWHHICVCCLNEGHTDRNCTRQRLN